MTGRAGLSKDIRDRILNHAKSDVSAVHHDRHDYLAEKRAAMDVWNAYLVQMLERRSAAPQQCWAFRRRYIHGRRGWRPR